MTHPPDRAARALGAAAVSHRPTLRVGEAPLPATICGSLAIAGPLLGGLALVYVTARPSGLAFAAGALLVVAVVVADGVVVARRRRRVGIAALASHLVLAGFLRTYCAAPLPAPPPLGGALPVATPPAGVAIYQLPTGVVFRTAAFAYRGGSPFDRRDFAMTAALVTHPRGDVLIDTGFGRELARQLPLMPLDFRIVTRYARGPTAAAQLDAAGYDRARLGAILLTHAHWDHASGLADFPGVPVLVTAAERRFIADGGWLTAVARSATAARFQEYGFAGGPYLGFPASHDLYGDGAIVIVPAAGHTPGSVIVFVTVPDGRRYAFVGDLAWQREGITARAERPWHVRRLADHDAAGVRANLRHMAAIAARFPEITLIPAHDQRGFAGLPRL